MSGPIGGAKISFRFTFGGGAGTGLSLAGFSVAPIPKARQGDAAWIVPEDGRHAAMTLGLSVLGTMGTGVMMRSLQPGQNPVAARDLVLDGLIGVQLGAGLIGHPLAESFFAGGVLSLPMQWLNHRRAPDWDYRVGMLTMGLLSMGRSALGGNPIPFQGYRFNDDGSTATKTGELFGNAATDIGCDALFFGLGNTLSAMAQGETDRDALRHAARTGGLYGAGVKLLTNAAFGAPVRIDAQLMADAIAMGNQPGAPDVGDVAKYTTFRTGGLVLLCGMSGITLGANVTMTGDQLGRRSLIYHELIHRDQMAGGWSSGGQGIAREGHGLLSFYGQYLIDAGRFGYIDIPYEREAFHYANGYGLESMAGIDRQYGDLIGHALNQLFVAWMTSR